MIRFIVRWYQRWKYGWSLDDAASVHNKIITGRDEMRPVTMTKYEERALRGTVNQGADYVQDEQ